MAAHLKELIATKGEIENDIKLWFEVLKTQGNVGMDTPLVDQEGYPRNDIDVTQVRTARHNIICMQNDHKSIMQEIEKGLIEHHAQHVNAVETESIEVQSSKQSTIAPKVELNPYAAVTLISPTSPAEMAGLKIGDKLLRFGSVTKKNFTGLNVIGDLVQHSKGKAVSVCVKRDDTVVTLTLVPQEWDGRGLLGCNIVPI
ncbi:26S proteasome non-ATPase regulatory subunit 9-like [Clavelina lepadiformis]|uniref:26S proteasome non-ATPase regulatory subunit 9-like n=1 Tax=Clavelina lepadiformis TaxID=159417 RepID=UPI0040435381